MKKYKLSNGLKVILMPKREGHSVGIALAVNFGSNLENEKHAGVAHYIEHMVFKGTKKRDKKQITLDIEKYGGLIGASTDFGFTIYYCTIPKKHVEIALDVIADMMFNSVFDHKELSLERNVILEDKMLWDTNPSLSILELFPQTIFKTHPVAKPTIGKVDTIKAMNREDMLAYYRKYYVPSNMVLAVVGNMKPAKVLGMAKKYYSMPRKPTPKIPIFNETMKLTAPRKSISKRDVSQSNMIIGFRFADARSKDWIIGKFIENLLGGGMSTRLFEEIRDKRGLVYDVSANYSAFRDYGMFEILAGAKQKNISKIKDLILKEFNRLRIEKVPKEEIRDIKSLMEGRYLIESEQEMAMATVLASREIVTKAEDVDGYIKNLKKITANDIMRVAKKYFEPKQYGLAAIIPKK